MSEPEQLDHGKIKLKNGRYFCWIHDPRMEVFGWIESLEGGIEKGTGGWYRTSEPEDAARIAEQQFFS